MTPIRVFTCLFILACAGLCLALAAFAAPTYSAGYLAYDQGRAAIQGFSDDAAKATVPYTVTAGSTETITVTGWVAIKYRATGDGQFYWNTDTTKYGPVDANTWETDVIHSGVTKFNYKNTGASSVTLYVRGM